MASDDCVRELIKWLNEVTIRAYLLSNLHHATYAGTFFVGPAYDHAKRVAALLTKCRKPTAFTVGAIGANQTIHYNAFWAEPGPGALHVYHFDPGHESYDHLGNTIKRWFVAEVKPLVRNTELRHMARNHTIQRATSDAVCQTWSLVWIQEHDIKADFIQTDALFTELEIFPDKAKDKLREYIHWWLTHNKAGFADGLVDRIVAKKRWKNTARARKRALEELGCQVDGDGLVDMDE